MKHKHKLILGHVAVLAVFALAGIECDGPPSQSRPASAVSTTPDPTSAPPATVYEPLVAYSEVVPQPPALVGPDTPCQEWVPTALSVGWSADRETIETLMSIIHRESRCNYDSFNPTDPNGGSRGLLQVNGFWCSPNRWTEQGFLQDKGVLSSCDELYDPATNLRASLIIYEYSLGKNDNGWHPWRK